jgi:hypothetical protein
MASWLKPHLQPLVAMQHNAPAIVGDHNRRSRHVDLGSVFVEWLLEPVEKLDESRNRPTFPSVNWPPPQDGGSDGSSQVWGGVQHPTTVRV